MKYLAVDIGNVIFDVKFKEFAFKMSESFGGTPEEAFKKLNNFQKHQDLGLSSLIEDLKEQFDIREPIYEDVIINNWNNIILLNIPMAEMLEDLYQNHDIDIAILSNLGVDHFKIVDKELSKYKFYTNGAKHFSYQVGARKPTKIFYQSFLSQYPEYKYCPYIDDLQENLDMGKQFGFNPIYFNLSKFSESERKIAILDLKLQILNASDIYANVVYSNKLTLKDLSHD